MAQMKVTTLLEEYQKWVNAGTIQFLKKLKLQEEVSKCINKLIPIMEIIEGKDKNGSDTPMKRAGEPVEVATSFLFLACDDSSYITGQVLHPNGGEIVNG